MVLLVRFIPPLLLTAPWIDERFRFADVHMDLERDIADFLSNEASILYSQGSSTIPCVISAFAKRGDIVVDCGISFAIQKGLQISRSTIRWFEHNDPRSLEDVLLGDKRERRKRPGPLTRRLIVTETSRWLSRKLVTRYEDTGHLTSINRSN